MAAESRQASRRYGPDSHGPIFRFAIFWAFCGAVSHGSIFLVEWQLLGSSDLRHLVTLVAGLALLPLGLGGLLLTVYSLVARNLQLSRTARLIAILLFLSPVATWFARPLVRIPFLWHLASKAQPVPEAILAYEADHGRPPFFLSELTPDYLDDFPYPPVEESYGYSYFVNSLVEGEFERVAFEIYHSSQREAPLHQPFGLMLRPQACLVVVLDRTRRVVSVGTNPDVEWEFEAPFDAESWRNDRKRRPIMVQELLASGQLLGMTELELIEALGDPVA